jgi:hypothetical protein
MISIEKIKKEFEYLSEADNENLYSGIWKFEKLNKSAELFFMSKNGNLTQSQINNFNYLVQKIDDVILQAENFISEDLKRKKYNNYEDFLKGKFDINIITIFSENNESDIEIICSKNYKKLFWNKRIDYVVFIKDSNISEIIKFGE